ncbi:MAG TPA: ABC transporter permease, partial [Thermoanaerobaculia bacterium]
MNGTSQTRPLYWSIRREVWENRFLYIAPLAVSAFVLFATFASMLWTVSQKRMPVKPISMAPAPVMFTILLVGFFYTLDALYGERRDRSILFWKSLPVSDFTVVASKAAIPFVVLPLFSWLLSVTMQVVLLLLSSPVLLANGISPASLASEMYFFEGLLIMFYGIGVHVLWFAPIYGWFILV